MSAGALPLARPADRRTLPAAPVRFAALAVFGTVAALGWGRMLEPAPTGRLLGCAAVALAAAGGLHAARGSWRSAPVLAAALAALLPVAGVPVGLLDPRDWGGLASGLGQGLGSLPAIGVPYRGVEPWVRIVLVLAGGALLVAGAALAVGALRRRARPVGAVVVLLGIVTVPVVERAPSHPFAWGVLVTLLVGLLLWGDRIERGHAAAAGVFVALAIGGALVLAPRLDAAEPWVDYQGLVESLSTPPATAFSWEHGYGPLDWPREQRVMLRVASDRPRYWKATDLRAFDGERWVGGDAQPSGAQTEFAPNHADWRVRLRVSVRDLRSPNYLLPGVGLSVSRSPRLVRAGDGGTFVTGRQPLRRGDSYAVEAYVPEPSARELRGAGTAYPAFVDPYLTMTLPQRVGGPAAPEGAPTTLPAELEFPRFSLLSARTPPAVRDGAGNRYLVGGRLLAASQYAPMWALARRLRAAANTPYEYVGAVLARLARGYRYSETPPAPRAGRPPLVSFLFDSRAGYCQQFSGAMALLLRMGGVPARVSGGFAPGTYDAGREEWVARDVDAHSWVEAYFPELGWITFDPTPGVAPPRTQLATGVTDFGGRDVALREGGRRADVPERAGGAPRTAVGRGARLSPWLALLLVLVAGAATGSVVVLMGRRRRARAHRDDLAELLRALRLTGRPVEPGLTLHALERRLGGEAGAYVAAVRARRFGGRPARPTREQRAALRRDLAAGLGVGGRLRAWAALPPLQRDRGPV